MCIRDRENANKNPTVNSVQRDYMAGEISKDLTARLLLDPEIVKDVYKRQARERIHRGMLIHDY